MKPKIKNPLKRVLNLILYLSFCFLIGTGLLLAYRLPPGSRGGHGLSVLGMSRHDWGGGHLWAGFVMMAAGFAHLLMNWMWLKKIAAKSHVWIALGGVMLGLAIILVFLLLPVAQSAGGGH